MKKMICLFIGILLISIVIIPTYSNASTETSQSNSKSASFLSFSFSNLISFFSDDKNTGNTQYSNYTSNGTYNSSNYSNNNNNSWWDCIYSWLCDGNKGNDGDWNHGGDWDDNQCRNDKSGFSNNHGCYESDEVWRMWYCY